MEYLGSKLKRFVQDHRGMYTQICETMLGGKKKGLDNYYQDGRNIRIDSLTRLLKATGMPLEYFVRFEPGELQSVSGCVGDNNININNSQVGDLNQKLEHVNEVLALKDQIIDGQAHEIALMRKRCDELEHQIKIISDNNRT